MTELDDAVIEEADDEGERLLPDELVELVERAHRDANGEKPGVPRDLVEEYLDALDERRGFDVGQLHTQLEEALVDERTFVDGNSVYDLGDGRVSAYPASWHEQLGEDADLTDFVYVMTQSMDDPPESGASPGVAKYDLFGAATTIGGVSRQEARERLKDLRADDVLVADADQHPRAGVSFAEDVDFEKDDLDKPDWGDRSAE